MKYKDHSAVLGVGRHGSERDIKKAYQRMAWRWHPDTNPHDVQAEEKPIAIEAACQVPGDERRRMRREADRGQIDWSQWFSGARDGAGVRCGADRRDLFGGFLHTHSLTSSTACLGQMGGRQDIRAAQAIFSSRIGGYRQSRRILRNASRAPLWPDVPAAGQGDARLARFGQARNPTRYCQRKDSWGVEPGGGGALRGTGPH